MTIFEYVRSRRMEEAQRMLRAGKLSVTEIAFEVGYEYSCNFSVAYKRHYGVTPKEERMAQH
jgi:AraC-like DNA-binding protein